MGLIQAQLSPDGRHVFAAARPDWSTQNAALLLVPTAGGQARELLPPSEGFGPGPYQWTPDSRAVIAFKISSQRRGTLAGSRHG